MSTCDHTLGWQPGNKCHCTECHEDFTNITNFDRHRRLGSEACANPSEVGLVYDEDRKVWKAKGERDPGFFAKKKGTAA